MVSKARPPTVKPVSCRMLHLREVSDLQRVGDRPPGRSLGP